MQVPCVQSNTLYLMLKKSLFPIIAGLLLTAIAGCTSDDRQYFDFEIQEIDEALSPEVMTGEAIELEYPKFILFSVYDTLCFLVDVLGTYGVFMRHIHLRGEIEK